MQKLDCDEVVVFGKNAIFTPKIGEIAKKQYHNKHKLVIAKYINSGSRQLYRK
jgi:hypothetical protein